MDGFCFWCFVTLYNLFPHVTPVYFIIHKHAEYQNDHKSYGALTHSATKPFSPHPIANAGPSPLNVLPQGFSSNHCSSCYLSCNARGIPGILHAMQDSQMALKEKWWDDEFVPEVQRVSTQGTLCTVWVQSLLLCGVLGVITLKSTPTISARTPPRPGLGSLTSLLPLALQGTVLLLRPETQFPAPCLSSSPNSRMVLPNLPPNA